MDSRKRQGNHAKGFHLSTDACEMLSQLMRVLGKSESFHADQAIRDYFMAQYLKHTQAYGKDWWHVRLTEYGAPDHLKLSRKAD